MVSVKARHQSVSSGRASSRPPAKRARPPPQSSSDGEYESRSKASSSRTVPRHTRSKSEAAPSLGKFKEEDELSDWDLFNPTRKVSEEEEVDELEDSGAEEGATTGEADAVEAEDGPYILRLRLPKKTA